MGCESDAAGYRLHERKSSPRIRGIPSVSIRTMSGHFVSTACLVSFLTALSLYGACKMLSKVLEITTWNHVVPSRLPLSKIASGWTTKTKTRESYCYMGYNLHWTRRRSNWGSSPSRAPSYTRFWSRSSSFTT